MKKDIGNWRMKRMLKIEKIKDEIKNFNDENNTLRCYLAQIATNQNYSVNCYRIGIDCSECLRLSLLELLEEYKEPIKLTRFEYEYLKVAKENEYNFIARDINNKLYGFSKRPKKRNITWDSCDDYECMFESMFKFVKWEDEEPYNIDEILSNCEPEEKWDKEEVFYNYPNCGVPLPYNFDYDYQIKNKCCLECRQVLDWSDIDDR